jgi:hypothetical protein
MKRAKKPKIKSVFFVWGSDLKKYAQTLRTASDCGVALLATAIKWLPAFVGVVKR